jgi:hypothetical protein
MKSPSGSSSRTVTTGTRFNLSATRKPVALTYPCAAMAATGFLFCVRIVWFRSRKPDSVGRLAALLTVISLSRAVRRGFLVCTRCDIPAAMGRAVQPPILSCTGLGFSCRPPHGERGGLLPHLFTMTLQLAGARRPQPGGLPVFCDTVRHLGIDPKCPGLSRSVPGRWPCGLPSRRDNVSRRESCPAVSGLSSLSSTGAALPAPWDQRTRSDDLAPKPREERQRKVTSLQAARGALTEIRMTKLE